MTKKLISLLLLLCFLGNIAGMAATDGNEAFMNLVNVSQEHLRIGIIATDIVQDTETNTITFKVRGGEDTSTYLIDENTVFYQPPSDVADDMATLEWFLDGRANGIDIVIEEADYYQFTKKQNETVHVSGVGGFFTRLVGVGGSSEKDDEEELFYNFFWVFGIMQHDPYAKGFDRVNITRGEMAQILINLLHLRGAEASIPKDQEFVDVPPEHWAYNAVHLCKQARLVSGYPDGTFGVDEQITYEQAVKMLVDVLGYTPMAKEKGGYPMGYLQVAEEIGITANTEFVATDLATRETVGRMIINLVYLPIMEQTGFGSEPRYEILEDMNFYEKYFR